MNISPILLLSLGASFALFYGLIITVGWAVTRKNRRRYHDAYGYSEVGLFDLTRYEPVGLKVKTVSLDNNHFISPDGVMINLKDYNCYIVEVASSEYPQIEKGDLILIEPSSDKIKYAFKIPDLKDFR